MLDKKVPLLEHLEELRRRLFICLAGIIAGAVISYAFIDKILSLFTGFLDRIIFIKLEEAFVTYIKISLFSGILLASPLIAFQGWRFIRCALTDTERKYPIIYVPLGVMLFLGGSAFCYFIILPWAVNFFLSFQTEKIVPMITLANFTSFSIMLILSFGILFELPLAVMFLSQLGIITPGLLRKKRKYAILVIFIVSAIVTPPDTVTQIILAIPLLALYEIGIFLSVLASQKNLPKG